ncbi:o-succinylbenzoate--CoA ligase [Lentilactobacillus otakiensis]|uniref:o-succinylbenzoate--CoA ligase n=1 Tax=Lentilactobacillus otakiensis TaxID=481720 RepID=UPI003D167AFF
MDNWILKQGELAPNRIAVDDGQTQLTFLELNQRTEALAGQLDQAGALNGERVAILTHNSLDGYLFAMAILGSGRTIVWINWRLSDDEIKRQLDDSKPSVCLVDDVLWRDSFDDGFIKFTEIRKIQAKGHPLVSEFNKNDVASIMYTSGTTGQPKGVMQTFGNHLASAMASALNLGLTSQDEWLCAVPIFHISGFSIMMRGLIYGMTVRLVSHFEPTLVDQILTTEPVSTISVVPYMLKKLLALREKNQIQYNANFRCMLLGGGPIDRQTLALCQKYQIPVVQSYGMTETCSQIVALNYEDAENRLGSVGKPLFLTQLKLAKNHEILLKTPALTKGYLNRPTALANKQTADGWYRTGDIGHFDDENFLYVDGRIDDMIISGGENVFPDEIEAVYLTRPDVDEIAVVGIDNPEWGQTPVAFVVSHRKVSPQALIDFGRQKLAHYKVPRQFIQVDHLPMNAGGKIQRFKLKHLL